MARIRSRLIMDETADGIITLHSRRPFLWFFWRGDAIRRRYASLSDAIMGLSQLYLQASPKRGARGRKERRRIAAQVAQRLVG